MPELSYLGIKQLPELLEFKGNTKARTADLSSQHTGVIIGPHKSACLLNKCLI